MGKKPWHMTAVVVGFALAFTGCTTPPKDPSKTYPGGTSKGSTWSTKDPAPTGDKQQSGFVDTPPKNATTPGGQPIPGNQPIPGTTPVGSNMPSNSSTISTGFGTSDRLTADPMTQNPARSPDLMAPVTPPGPATIRPSIPVVQTSNLPASETIHSVSAEQPARTDDLSSQSMSMRMDAQHSPQIAIDAPAVPSQSTQLLPPISKPPAPIQVPNFQPSASYAPPNFGNLSSTQTPGPSPALAPLPGSNLGALPLEPAPVPTSPLAPLPPTNK